MKRIYGLGNIVFSKSSEDTQTLTLKPEVIQADSKLIQVLEPEVISPVEEPLKVVNSIEDSFNTQPIGTTTFFPTEKKDDQVFQTMIPLEDNQTTVLQTTTSDVPGEQQDSIFNIDDRLREVAQTVAESEEAKVIAESNPVTSSTTNTPEVEQASVGDSITIMGETIPKKALLVGGGVVFGLVLLSALKSNKDRKEVRKALNGIKSGGSASVEWSKALANIASGKGTLEFAAGIALLIGSGVGVYYLFKNNIREDKVNDAEDKAQFSGNPENFALRIYNTFGFWNDDEDELYKVLQEIPTKDFYEDVQAAYKQLYGKTVQDEFSSLSQSEMLKALEIIDSKP